MRRRIRTCRVPPGVLEIFELIIRDERNAVVPCVIFELLPSEIVVPVWIVSIAGNAAITVGTTVAAATLVNIVAVIIVDTTLNISPVLQQIARNFERLCLGRWDLVAEGAVATETCTIRQIAPSYQKYTPFCENLLQHCFGY
jgi:hypothetical protein